MAELPRSPATWNKMESNCILTGATGSIKVEGLIKITEMQSCGYKCLLVCKCGRGNLKKYSFDCFIFLSEVGSKTSIWEWGQRVTCWTFKTEKVWTHSLTAGNTRVSLRLCAHELREQPVVVSIFSPVICNYINKASGWWFCQVSSTKWDMGVKAKCQGMKMIRHIIRERMG